jgi:hypothetical protein
MAHGVAGWALSAATTAIPAIHAIAAPLVFAGIAWHYFRARGARDAAPAAVVWTVTVALLDLVVVAGAVQHSLEMFRSVAGSWLPFGLILIVTWVTGEAVSMMPEAKRTDGRPSGATHGMGV